MKYNLDYKNRHILELLQQNSKLSVKEIASHIKLSFTPTYERIKNLEEAGIIKKYVALVDKRKVGLNVTAFCNITLKEQSKKTLMEFENAIKDIPEVTEIISVSGNYDYMVKILATDIESYNTFVINTIANLPNIGLYHSNIILSEVKNETAIKIPEPEDDK